MNSPGIAIEINFTLLNTVIPCSSYFTTVTEIFLKEKKDEIMTFLIGINSDYYFHKVLPYSREIHDIDITRYMEQCYEQNKKY